MLLLPLLCMACAQTPKKVYEWTSLSEKGFTKNSLTVLKEQKDFNAVKGYENLNHKKQPLPDKKTESIKKIILMGDTGCRLKETKWGDAYQNCKDPKEWPYKNVIEKVASENPDLILHLGDYHYRDHCSEGKVCRQYTDVIGFGWRGWEAEFFAPSRKALEKVPWLFVRGNHEDCHRAYEGYKILSEQTWNEACVKTEKTEYIDLGNLLIVHLDTASISDKPESAEVVKFWEEQFKEIEARLQKVKGKKIWLVTHKPIIALVEERNGILKTSNVNLQNAFLKTGLGRKIDYLIAGHIHTTQFLKADGFPKQLVVGNGGTALDQFKTMRNPEAVLRNKVDGIEYTEFFSDTKDEHSFGYAVLTKVGENNWKVQFKDLNGEVTFTK